MFRPLFLIGVAALAVACGGGRRDIVHKPGEVYVGSIEVEGNTAIPTSDLVSGLAQARTLNLPIDVDPYQTQLDEQRIKGAYLRLGFFTVDVSARVDKRGDARVIIYTVKEGPRATVAAVSFLGLPPGITEAAARALVKLPDGAPFDYDPYDDAKDDLLRLLEDSGYAHARLDATVTADRVHAQATLEYTIAAGPRCTFGDIAIEGVPAGGLADAIRVRVAFHRGDPYSFSAVEKTQRALYGVGRFSTVRVQPALGDDKQTTIGVKIVVSEANRHELRTGVGVGLDPLYYSARFRAQYTQDGVFDPLTTFAAEFRPELTLLRDTSGASEEITPLVRLIGRLTRQDLLFPNVKGELEGGLDYLTIEAYTQTGARARVGISGPLGTDKLQARVGWTFAVYSFSNVSPAVDAAEASRLGLDSTERLGAYTQAITLDLRDNPIEPTSGLFAAFQIAEGSKYALGGLDYLEMSPVLRVYLPLVGGIVLAGRLHVATISGDVPVTERFYAGGASSDRGFSERRLSPVAMAAQTDGSIDTVVIGGAGLIETGGELRVPLGAPGGLRLGFVVFLDGGDCTDQASQLDLGNLNWAAGGGLRIFTPIGPARFDVGYRLNRFGPTDPEPGDRLEYFLGFGEAY
nr:BamA/TamA family outer membrane protein [Kofleriaceae bacterium]